MMNVFGTQTCLSNIISSPYLCWVPILKSWDGEPENYSSAAIDQTLPLFHTAGASSRMYSESLPFKCYNILIFLPTSPPFFVLALLLMLLRNFDILAQDTLFLFELEQNFFFFPMTFLSLFND